jgi:hypothetical protein
MATIVRWSVRQRHMLRCLNAIHLGVQGRVRDINTFDRCGQCDLLGGQLLRGCLQCGHFLTK